MLVSQKATKEGKAGEEVSRTVLFKKSRFDDDKILAEARAAQRLAWDAKRTAVCRTIFPQMTNQFPDDEGTALRV